MKNRVVGLDLARAVALLGMIVVNFHYMIIGNIIPKSDLGRFIEFLTGKSSALFVILAGIGISLYSKDSLPQARLSLVKRAIFLLLLGLTNLYFFEGDILHFYGFYILISTLFLNIKRLPLFIISLIPIVISVILLFTFDYDAEWNWKMLSYSNFWTFKGFFKNLLFNGFHPLFPWLSFILFGMIIGKANLTCYKTCLRIFIIGAFLFTASTFLSTTILETFPTGIFGLSQEYMKALFGTDVMPPMPLYIGAATGFSLIVISTLLILAKYAQNNSILKVLSFAGQQTLTIYIAHIITELIFNRFIESYNTLPANLSMYFSLIFFCLAVTFATIWGSMFKRGPLELLMRRIT